MDAKQRNDKTGVPGRRVDISGLNYAVSLISNNPEDSIESLIDHALNVMYHARRIEREGD